MPTEINNAERDKLFNTIYKIATDLVHAGHVSEWDFKSYVLGTMFYRYISESFTALVNKGEHEFGNTDFDYAKLSDDEAEGAREGLINDLGYFILPSQLFENVKARAKNDENLNVTLEKIFTDIEDSAKGTESENDFAGLFDDFDVNSKSIGETVAKRNKVLVELLEGVAKMPMYNSQTGADFFGDAYEYLMGMYASNAGKKGGQYFTPADVSMLLARLGTIGKKQINKVYDPACGSGSLLLKVEKVLGKGNVKQGFFGQEIDLTTYNLCRINMFLHDIRFDKFSIIREDTLVSPQHWDDQPFELIVSNPPFSVPWEGEDNATLINDPRFSPAGVLAPKSKGDMAFIMHSLHWLATNGTAAIVCFPGIMYRSGAEQKIRKYLVENNYIDTVIQLPSNLFLNVTISVDIMLLKKNKKDTGILFIDASNECVKVTKNNRLTEENIDNIVNAVAERTNKEHFCRLVPFAEVKNEKFNLSVSTYVQQPDTRESVDIDELDGEIDRIFAHENELRTKISKIIKEIKGDAMSTLEELIEKYCPDGVEWKTLGELVGVNRGSRLTKSQLDDNFVYEVYHGSKDTILGKYNSFNAPANTTIVVNTGGIGGVKFMDKDFWCSDGSFWLGQNEKVNPKYLYYSLSGYEEYFASKKRVGGVPTIDRSVIEDFSIPLPPLPVQEEIVRILDQFTNLSAELKAELKARKVQYEYYRDQLLIFKEKTI